MSGKSNHIESLSLKNKKRGSLGKLSRLERYGSLQNERETFKKNSRKKLLIPDLKQNQKRKRMQHQRNTLIIAIVCLITVLLSLLIIL